VVGADPKRTYMSASPVPPAMVNFRLLAPAGTFIVQNCWLPEAPLMLLTGTPFCSTLLAVPTVTDWVRVLVAPPSSVTVSATV
jgi:hypothetical protein